MPTRNPHPKKKTKCRTGSRKSQFAALSEKIDKLSERQNAFYAEIMLNLNFINHPKKNPASNRTTFNATYSEPIEQDEMYEKARAVVIATQRASSSLLQRALGIGYSRAAKLMDMLEAKGVVGPSEGSSPRDVLLDEDEE